MSNHIRNITIGMIDGLIIPFALATGMSVVIEDTSIILMACLTVSLAGSLTMATGAYLQSKKYEPGNPPLSSALMIGLSYIAGGIICSVPYMMITDPSEAFLTSAVITLPLLFACGYLETKVLGHNGWTGGLRTVLTASAAALAAFIVAGLFGG